jgi:hypothetical protein
MTYILRVIPIYNFLKYIFHSNEYLARWAENVFRFLGKVGLKMY